jgi:hypothetical protein
MSPHFTAVLAELHRADLLADAERHRWVRRTPRTRQATGNAPARATGHSGRVALAVRASFRSIWSFVTRA